jgi:hypothetical protein
MSAPLCTGRPHDLGVAPVVARIKQSDSTFP